MIGPWPHTFNTPFRARKLRQGCARFPLRPEQLKWFDRWVKGKDVPDSGHPRAHLRDGH
jgi:hypothetical protein